MEQHEFQYGLGWKAKDILTGFEGTIVYRVEFMTGCDQYGIQPYIDPLKKNEIPDSKQFDEGRLEILDRNPVVFPNMKPVEEGKAPPGGPNYDVKY